MKIKTSLVVLMGALLFQMCTMTGKSQGTVSFNQTGIPNNTAHYLWSYNDISGMEVKIFPQVPDNYLVRLTQLAGHPTNGSPHMEHIRFDSIPSYAVFSLTNGLPFGLVSVDLADPVAPSLSPISITFNGYLADNSMVSQTFTVGGGGSTTFQTFTFDSAFAYGLTRVEIPSAAWAMDNLVFVPEPGTVSLSLLGLAALTWHLRRRKTAP